MKKSTLQFQKIVVKYIQIMSKAQCASSPEEVIEFEKEFKKLSEKCNDYLKELGENDERN